MSTQTSTETLERKEVRLSFAPDISNEPLVCHLVRDYNVLFNILNAQIGARKEGHLTLELLGKIEDIENAVDYLKECGIKVLGFSHEVCFHEELCMHCGMCTSMCKFDAIFVDKTTRLTTFDKEKCTACGQCTKVCPVHAMQRHEQQKAL